MIRARPEYRFHWETMEEEHYLSSSRVGSSLQALSTFWERCASTFLGTVRFYQDVININSNKKKHQLTPPPPLYIFSPTFFALQAHQKRAFVLFKDILSTYVPCSFLLFSRTSPLHLFPLCNYETMVSFLLAYIPRQVCPVDTGFQNTFCVSFSIFPLHRRGTFRSRILHRFSSFLSLPTFPSSYNQFSFFCSAVKIFLLCFPMHFLCLCVVSSSLYCHLGSIRDCSIWPLCPSVTFPPPSTSKIPSCLNVFLILWSSFFRLLFLCLLLRHMYSFGLHFQLSFTLFLIDVIYHLNSALTCKWAILTLLNTIPLGLSTGVSSWICSW